MSSFDRSALHLVTGGSGYFGSCLVRALANTGARVRLFDINAADDLPEGVEFHQGDIRDPVSVEKAVDGASFVYQNIALVPLAKDKNAFYAVNFQGMERLLRFAEKSGVKKVVYTSTSAVYGVPESNPVNEFSPRVPREDYGRSKLQAEQLCERLRQSGVPVSIIRPRTILGVGRLGIFQILFDWVSQGYNVPVFDGGRNLYQFVHAADLADACIRAAASPGSEDFNIGADRFGTMRELLESLCRHAATGSKVRSVPMRPVEMAMKVTSGLGLSPLGPYHAMMYGRSLYFDVSKAKALLGWAPRYSSAQMIMESYDWYLKNRAAILAQTGGSPHRSAVRQRILRLVKHLL